MKKNKSGSYKGAPNFPKSQNFNVFFRGGNNDSREEARTEIVNNVELGKYEAINQIRKVTKDEYINHIYITCLKFWKILKIIL